MTIVSGPPEDKNTRNRERITEQRDRDNLAAAQRAADATASQAYYALPALIVSGISTFLVVFALGLAFDSNRIARDSSERQLRAYVGHSNHEVKMHINGTIDYHIHWHNSGQTPAYYCDAYIDTISIEGDLPTDFAFERPRNSQPVYKVLNPQQGMTSATGAITTAQLNDCLDKGMRTFMWGKLVYRDAFGCQRYSKVAAEIVTTRFDQINYRTMFMILDRFNEAT